nr:hypothetical protein [Agrococcus sp. REN33]
MPSHQLQPPAPTPADRPSAADASAPSTPGVTPDTGEMRRLEVSDVLVVKQRKVRTAITGTVVGNFMEWFDFGIYGYLAVTMTAVFTAGMERASACSWCCSASRSRSWCARSAGWCSARWATGSAARRCCSSRWR